MRRDQSAGVVVSAAAAFSGRWIDNLLRRLLELFMALPSLVTALAISAVLGPSFSDLLIALVVANAPWYARTYRPLVLGERGHTYVEAAVVVGAGQWRIILTRHPAPASPHATLTSTEGCVQQFRLAQLTVFGAFAVLVGAAMVRMSQMIDYDEPWHGPIANYTNLTARYPVINVLAALNGVFLLVTAIALLIGLTALATRRWRASSLPTVVAGAALGAAGLALGGWGVLIAVLAQDVEWSALVGAVAGLSALIAAAYAYRSAPFRIWSQTTPAAL